MLRTYIKTRGKQRSEYLYWEDLKFVDGYAQSAMDRYEGDSIFNTLHSFCRCNSARMSFIKLACLSKVFVVLLSQSRKIWEL
jgi:hypothetical protein